MTSPAASLRSVFKPAFQSQSPLFDFLLPRFQRFPRPVRYASTTSSLSQNQEEETKSQESPNKRKSVTPLSKKQQEFLDRALRVNQAGELAATLIYTAQTPPIIKAHPHLRPLMHHMYAQEASHFATFNTLLARHRVRPTAMYPIWKVAATVLGWSTAMMGREAAMACTEAVETEIGQHYNGQIRELLSWIRGMEERGEEFGEEIKNLIGELKRIRDEELEHLDSAVGEDAKQAGGYELLNRVVRGGCKGAIWISERF